MGRAGQKRDMEIIRDGDVERERVRETEMKRKTKAKARAGERGRRRKGNFLGQREEMLPPSLLSQRSPRTRARLSMVDQGRAEMPMDPPGPAQTCPSPFLGSSFQSPPRVSPRGSPLSSPSLSTGPEFITHPFDLPTSGQPSPFLCEVRGGGGGVWPKGLSHSLCIYCSFLSCLTPLILLVSAPKSPPPGSPP